MMRGNDLIIVIASFCQRLCVCVCMIIEYHDNCSMHQCVWKADKMFVKHDDHMICFVVSNHSKKKHSGKRNVYMIIHGKQHAKHTTIGFLFNVNVAKLLSNLSPSKNNNYRVPKGGVNWEPYIFLENLRKPLGNSRTKLGMSPWTPSPFLRIQIS